MNQSVRIARVLLFVAPLLWTVNYLVARWAPGVITPHALALGRWALALLLICVAMGRERKNLFTAFADDWPIFLLMGGLGMWICGAFVYIGGQSTQAINIALIYAASPIGVALISYFKFHEKLNLWQVGGIGLALTGVLLIIAKGNVNSFIHFSFNVGDWWIVIAAVAWSIYSILMRHRASNLSGNLRLAAIILGGVVVLIPFTLIEWLAPQWMPGASAVTMQTGVTGKAIVLIVLAAVFPGFLAYRSFSYVVTHLGSAPAGLMLYLGPLYAAVVGWIVLNEPLQWYHAVGALFILPGVYFAGRPATK